MTEAEMGGHSLKGQCSVTYLKEQSGPYFAPKLETLDYSFLLIVSAYNVEIHWMH